MSVAATIAAVAVATQVVGVVLGHRSIGWLAAVVCLLAAAMRAPLIGHAGLGLVVSASLALTASQVASKRRSRFLHLCGLAWAVPAIATVPTLVAANTGLLTSTIIALTVSALMLGGVGRWLMTRSSPTGRAAVAALVAILPLTPGGAFLPLGARIEMPLSGTLHAWLQGDGLAVDPATWSGWVGDLWQATPALWFACVVWCWCSQRGLYRAVALGLAALVGGLEVAAQWSHVAAASAAMSPLVAPDHAFVAQITTLSQWRIDAAPALLLMARLLTITLLVGPIWSAVSRDDRDDVAPGWLDRFGMVLGWGLLLLWAVLAPNWAGTLWFLDPAAMALFAVVGCAHALHGEVSRDSTGERWLRVGQTAAALLIVGGGQIGWRVSGMLLAN